MSGINLSFGPDNSINWSEKDINMAIQKKEYNKKINNDTMLMHAAKTNDIELAKKLLKLKADPSIGDSQDRTPLWLCTIYNRPEIAKLLIKNGASLEDIPGTNSPLYNAIKHDNNEVAKELIKLGADVNILNRDNQTPLHCAVFRNNAEMVKVLLNNGADKSIVNTIKPIPGEIVFEKRNPQTALDIAKEKGYKEIIKLLENEKVDSKKKNHDDDSKKEVGNHKLSEKDWDTFYEYLLNNTNLESQQEKYSEFMRDYQEFEGKFLKDEFDTDYYIISNYDRNDILTQTVTYEDYKDKIAYYKELVDNKNEIVSTINKKKEPLEELDKSVDFFAGETRYLETQKKSAFSDFLKEEATACYSTYIILVVLGIAGGLMGSAGGGWIILSGILGLIALGAIGSFFQSTVESLKKYSVIVFLYLIGGIIIKSIIIQNNELSGDPVYLMAFSHTLIETPLVMLGCFFARYKNEKDKNLNDLEESNNNFKEAKKDYEKEKRKIEKSIETEKKELKKIEATIEELENEKIDKEKYISQVNDMKIFFEASLLQAKRELAQRWNDFSDFRKDHYVREIEEKIQEDGIFNDLLDLLGDESLLNSTKYNSKNYNKEGTYSDYVKYIYNIIDSEFDSL